MRKIPVHMVKLMPTNRSQFEPRKKRSYMNRPVDAVETRQRILIVCEGEETEKNYFEKFRVTSLRVKVLGIGLSNESLVDWAITYPQRLEYDQVWCVFDKDDCSIAQYERAVRKARSNSMRVVFSNQSFELWFVLHIEDLTSATDKETYINKLTRFLGFKYDKSDPRLYDKFLPYIDTAILRADRLLDRYQPPRPWHNDPSTNVHNLVLILQEQAKPLR